MHRFLLKIAGYERDCRDCERKGYTYESREERAERWGNLHAVA